MEAKEISERYSPEAIAFVLNFLRQNRRLKDEK